MNKIINNNKGFSLISSLLLTFLMFINIRFFHLSGKSGISLAASIIIAGYLLTIFFLILYTGKISKYRRIFLVTAALLFFPAFIAVLLETRGHMTIGEAEILNTETPMCHIVIPMTIIPQLVTKTFIFPARLTNHFASVYSMIIIWFIATVTIGRGWCSWVCFYGGWEDGASRILKKPVIRFKDDNMKIRLFNFAFLTFIVLGSLLTLSSIYCEWFCPFKIITEYSEITDLASFIAFILMVLIFFGLVIIMPILTRIRFQCTTFCPFGAFQSIVGKLSLYSISIQTDKCIKCLKCVHSCPTLSITKNTITGDIGKPLLTCTKCGECIQVCPENAIEYSFSHCRNPEIKPFSYFISKITNKSSILYRVLKKFGNMVDEILSPRSLLVFSGYTIGMIITTTFATGTIIRLINLFVTGSFLLK